VARDARAKETETASVGSILSDNNFPSAAFFPALPSPTPLLSSISSRARQAARGTRVSEMAEWGTEAEEVELELELASRLGNNAAATPPRSIATSGEERRAPQGWRCDAWAPAPERASRASEAEGGRAEVEVEVGVEVDR